MKNATISTTSRSLVTSLAAVGFSFLVASDASAQTSTWGQTAGGTYTWNTSGNWTGGIPNAAGATAALTNAITGATTVDLGSTNETTGTLKIGASTANTFTLSSTGGGVLTLQSSTGAAGVGITEASNNADSISAGLKINDTGGLTITDSATTSTLTISGGITSGATGENLTIKANGGGAVLLSTTSINNQGTITNSGTGTNTTIISSAIGANVTSITENSATSALTLSGANSSFTGSTTVTSGTLNINNVSALGTGTLNLSGGSIDNTSSGSFTNAGNNAINFNNSFTFGGTQSLNLGSGAVTTGTGSKTITVNANTLEMDGVFSVPTGTLSPIKAGAGTLVLGGNGSIWNGTTTVSGGTLMLTGSVNVGGNGVNLSAGSGSTLDLSTSNAAAYALTTTGTVTAGAGTTIILDNRNGNEGFNVGGQQLSSGAHVTLGNTSSLIYEGATTGDTMTQTINLTLGNGISTVTAVNNNSTSGATKLTLAGISGGVGTGLINGVNLGIGSITGATPFILASTTPTLVGATPGTNAINTGVDTTQIVPFLLGESGTATGAKGTATGTANTFLTYNSTTGFRPLNPTDEFKNNSIVSGDNTYITAATAATGSTSINSLVINGGDLNIAGTGTVTNASGALLFVTNNKIAGGTYNLGANAGYFTADAGVNAVISSAIIGTGTETFYGSPGSSIDLAAANTLTGITSVTTGASILVGNNGAFGTSTLTSPAGLISSDNQARTINNLYSVSNGGGAGVGIGGSNDFTFGAPTTGPAITLNGNTSAELTIVNTGVTYVPSWISLFNSATGGYANNGEGVTMGASANLVVTGSITDNNSGNVATGTGSIFNFVYKGAGSNITLNPTANNAYGGSSGTFTVTGGTFFDTVTLGGPGGSGAVITPFGVGTFNTNAGGVFFVAANNGQIINNAFTFGGSVGNFPYSIGFAGNNSMTWGGTFGNPSTFENIAGSTATLTLGGAVTVNAIAGPGNTTLSSSSTLSGSGTLTHIGTGTLMISGANNMTSLTSFNGGTTVLDYTSNSTTKLSQSSVASAAALTLQGVNVKMNVGSGGGTQALGSVSGAANGTTLNSGQSNVTNIGAGTELLETGTITRSTGGVLNVGAGSTAISNSNNSAGIIGAWATVGGSDWAVSNGATTAVTALGSYTTWSGSGSGAATNNYLLSTGGSYSTPGNYAAYTLKFATASGTLSLASTSTLTLGSNGGLLFTGTGNYGITSGTLTTSGSDIIVNQYSSGTVTLGSVISGTESVTLAGGGVVALTGANTYTGSTYVDGDLLQISADNNIGNAGSLVLQGGTLETTAGYTTSRAVTIGADGGTFQVDTGTLTLSGAISGGSAGNPGYGVALNKTGAGMLVIGGNNTSLIAAVTVSQGTLQLTSATALGTASTGTTNTNNRSVAPLTVNGGALDIDGQTIALGNITLASGSIVDSGSTAGTLTGYSFNLQSGTVGAALIDDIIPGTISNSINLYKTTSGTVVLTGNNTYSGATQISGGVLQIGNGGTTGSLGTANVTTNGNGPAWLGTTAGSGTIAFNRSNSITVANAISGTGGVTQMGTGTLTLTGNNSYSGTTAINNGTLAFGTLSALSSSTVQPLGNTSGITLGVAGTSSGVLRYTGSTATLTAGITALGNGNDTVQNAGSGLLTLGGGLVKNGTTLTLNAGTGGINVTGVISGSATNSDMDFTGGTTTISTAATYNGPTWIYGGGVVVAGVTNALPTSTSLNLGTPGANGSATSSTTTAATFDLNGNAQTVASLNTEGTGGYTSDIVTNNGSSDAALTVSNGGTFAGVIKNGTTNKTALSLTGGVMTLSGANTYTGATTVGGGKLLLTGSLASGSAVTVGNNTSTAAILSGTGTASGNVSTVTSGSNVAYLAPGVNTSGTRTDFGGTGTLSIGGNLSLGTGTNLDYDLSSSHTSGNDQIAVGGTLSIGTALTFNYNQSSGSLDTTGAYQLITFGGTAPSLGGVTFSSNGTGSYTAVYSIDGGGQALDVSFSLPASTPTAAFFNGQGTDLGTFANYDTTVSSGAAVGAALGNTTNVSFNANRNTTVSATTLNSALDINSVTFGTGSGIHSGMSITGSGTMTIEATTANGNTIGNGITVNTGGGNNSIGTAVALGNDQSWTVTDSTSTLTVGGTVSGAHMLTKAGAGVLALSGSNTFGGGAVVNAGTLLINNTAGSATGTTTLAVNAGATLAGNGTSSGTSFNISGTGTATGARANVLVGLTSATDTLTTSVLTLKGSTGSSTIANANLTFNLDAKSTASTQLSVGNTAIAFGTGAGSVKFTLDLQNEPAIVGAYTMYTLIAGTGSNQYSGLTLGNVINLGGGATETIITGSNLQLAFGNSTDQSYYANGSYLVLYQSAGVDNIDVVVVPEPGTWAMMLGGLVALVFWQRSRRKGKL